MVDCGTGGGKPHLLELAPERCDPCKVIIKSADNAASYIVEHCWQPHGCLRGCLRRMLQRFSDFVILITNKRVNNRTCVS